MKKYFICVAVLVAGGCAHESLTPNPDQLKVSKESPKSNCTELGPVSGRTISSKGNSEEALADMKKDASRLSANYVQILEYSGTGTAVTGTAYRCQ